MSAPERIADAFWMQMDWRLDEIFQPPSRTPAMDYMLEEGCHTEVIDILCELLAARGMTRDEVDAALNKACGEWLEDQTEKWWEI